jgi:hypothetical protein
MSPVRISRLESAMRVVLAFNEAFNRHDVAGMMQLMSDDCVFENTAPAPMALCTRGRKQSLGSGRSKGTCPGRRYLPSEERFYLPKIVVR